jgi:hypothetical protein
MQQSSKIVLTYEYNLIIFTIKMKIMNLEEK